MFGSDAIFSEFTICKLLKIKLDKVPINLDQVKLFETSYNMFRVGYEGIITIEDTFGDLSSKWTNNKTYLVEVTAIDNTEVEVNLTFTSTSVNIITQSRNKVITLTLRDPISFELFNTNGSDSFTNKSYVSAFIYYIGLSYYRFIKKYQSLISEVQSDKSELVSNENISAVRSVSSRLEQLFNNDKGADKRLEEMIKKGNQGNQEKSACKFIKDIYNELFKNGLALTFPEIRGSSNPLSFTTTNSSSGKGSKGAIFRYFLEKFRSIDYRVYNERNQISIYQVSLGDVPQYVNLLEYTKKRLSSLDKIQGPIRLTNININQIYQFHIHEYKRSNANRVKQFHFKNAQRLINGQIVVDKFRLDDIKQYIELNSNFNNYKSILINNENDSLTSNASESVEAQRFDAFESLIKSNELVVYIPGRFYHGIGTIIETELTLPNADNDKALKGDPTLSGKWLITRLTDKIIGDKFIQRLVLNRFDNPVD